MQISHPLVLKHLQQLLKTHTLNVDVSLMWLDFLKTETSFTTKKSLSKTMSVQGLDQRQAFVHQFLSEVDLDSMSDQEKTSIYQRVNDSIQPLVISDYLTNPYYKAVKPEAIQIEDWAITYQTLLPFQGCVYDDVKMNASTFVETTPIGYVDQPFPYLAIQQHQTTWMSVTPFEIHTMEPILKTLKGHVVALGLGLGYFAFMAALNPNVTHITVIEKDKTAIDLFLKYIFSYFPHPNKITIVHQDALDYVSVAKKNIDHVFVDIYHTADDGLPLYLMIKKKEPLWKNTVFSYWLEQSMLGLLRRYMFVFLSLPVKATLKVYPPWAVTLLENIKCVSKDTVIDSIFDLNQWLSSDHILKMIQQFP